MQDISDQARTTSAYLEDLVDIETQHPMSNVDPRTLGYIPLLGNRIRLTIEGITLANDFSNYTARFGTSDEGFLSATLRAEQTYPHHDSVNWMRKCIEMYGIGIESVGWNMRLVHNNEPVSIRGNRALAMDALRARTRFIDDGDTESLHLYRGLSQLIRR